MVFAPLQVGPEARRIKTDTTVLIMDSKRRMIDALHSICKVKREDASTSGVRPPSPRRVTHTATARAALDLPAA